MFAIEHYGVDCCVIFGPSSTRFSLPVNLAACHLSNNVFEQGVLKMRNAVVSLLLEEWNTG